MKSRVEAPLKLLETEAEGPLNSLPNMPLVLAPVDELPLVVELDWSRLYRSDMKDSNEFM
jgi:hypothetical protein